MVLVPHRLFRAEIIQDGLSRKKTKLKNENNAQNSVENKHPFQTYRIEKNKVPYHSKCEQNTYRVEA